MFCTNSGFVVLTILRIKRSETNVSSDLCANEVTLKHDIIGNSKFPKHVSGLLRPINYYRLLYSPRMASKFRRKRRKSLNGEGKSKFMPRISALICISFELAELWLLFHWYWICWLKVDARKNTDFLTVFGTFFGLILNILFLFQVINWEIKFIAHFKVEY